MFILFIVFTTYTHTLCITESICNVDYNIEFYSNIKISYYSQTHWKNPAQVKTYISYLLIFQTSLKSQDIVHSISNIYCILYCIGYYSNIEFPYYTQTYWKQLSSGK